MSTRFALLLSLPVAIAGSLAAHAVAYLIAVPDSHERATLLERTGHGYLAHLPVLAGAGLALALAAGVSHAARGRPGARPSPWVFALLPPLAFVLQEHLERLPSGGALLLETALDPTFVIGLALQLPFALLAYALVGVLLRAAEALGLLLVSPPRLRVRAIAAAGPSPTARRHVARAAANAQRGPPSRLVLSH
jgi:hypothetical protein